MILLMKRCDVGGQAVIEGVMMRGSKSLATAVRTPKGNIEIDFKDNRPITKKYPILNIPFLRGFFVLDRFNESWNGIIKLFSFIFRR